MIRLENRKLSADEIPGYEDLLHRLKTDENILFVLIFGSFANGRIHKNSDLDLGIYFEKPPEGLVLLDLINELSNIACIEVDLIVLNRASAFLRHEIMKNALRLMIKDRNVYRDFRESTITDYNIYRYLSGIYDHDQSKSDRKETPQY